MSIPPLVEEINWRTYNPNVYFTSIDGPSTRSNRVSKKTANASASRSTKRVNYSLADLEARLYTASNENEDGKDNDQTSSNSGMLAEKYTEAQIIQSKKRFMELDTENFSEQSEVPGLLSSLTGISKDNIESSSGGGSNIRHKNKFDIPKNLDLSYRSTKPTSTKRKNTNRIVALKKILTSRRTFQSYADTLDKVNKQIIFNNVYNKKFLKVLPLIIICSVCGGTNGISGCVSCGDKLCSVGCFKLHNDTRCSHTYR
ncbi:hypothetical protein Kpol_363p5 [Vanderwaltozyma polyspora DSM 70294]|uniref:HIT-type domain-containing protein n=1 Tax=Vanderwaltozyma polyspora (strain ATCC 22028 / DSM 70294 / BCRC 21397 / CBS 2163 / NBRC 10782 / NRRL Y-8283 / UCD 57-17) TaxID=436907 RepID=A7TS88_VANPO|nr:uncharacterized protein Kpol_363p5 [Vanderwaltozyma polyspora DSM 70294]EDO14865.1 hypothetical protein Kpol_363p5 [Vanderwaltozyma polyspora DSM 70294]